MLWNVARTMNCNDEIYAKIRHEQQARREKELRDLHDPDTILRNEHIVRESNKRLAFVKALIENGLLETWQESGIKLAPVAPVENLGFPIP